jgi:cytidine diphosphoramidate kinase
MWVSAGDCACESPAKASIAHQPEAEHEVSAGRVFWITGLSGAGKTTLGRELSSRLRAAGRPVTFLDGDALRSAIAEDLGHSAEDRRRSAMRNARLCRLLAEQGVDVVCATISLFHEVQRWNRENIPGYREIYLRVPIDELRRRDSKGIYAGAQRGERATSLALTCRRRLPRRRTWSSTIMGARRCHGGRPHPGGMRQARCRRVRRSRRGSSPSKRRRKLWKRWRRCCAMGASCRRFDSRLAIGARTPPACSLPSPLRPGVQIGSSCAAVHAARTAPRGSQAGKVRFRTRCRGQRSRGTGNRAGDRFVRR